MQVFKRKLGSKTYSTCYIPCIVLQSLGARSLSEIHREELWKPRSNNKGKNILGKNTLTPCPTPFQTHWEGSRLVAAEARSQGLYFFSFGREKQRSKKGPRIRLEVCTSPGSLFSVFHWSAMILQHSCSYVRTTSHCKSWHVTCPVLNEPLDPP